MRKNTKEVLQALTSGKSCSKCEAIHTNGSIVASYRTIVAIRDPNDTNHWYVTEPGAHSLTTTIQTNGLASGLVGLSIKEFGCFKVTRVPQGTIDKIVRSQSYSIY